MTKNITSCKYNFLSGYCLVILICITTSCEKKYAHTESSESDHENGKALPDEWLLRQRMYPSGEIDDKSYKDGLAFRAARIKENLAQARVNSFAQEWEFAGPTNVGGRITDVEISSESEFTYYAGAASGGIFKTYDGGTSWIPLFDDQTHLAIGDIAIAPSDNQILYVGTGEPNAGGGSLAYDGNGVHRSDDGGDSWKHLGLDEIGSSGKIVIDPKNPDRCFVAGMGKLFKNDEHRGVFRTEDGGDSWEKVLYINDSTGIIDLAMNFQHPDTIYAAAWQRTRRVNKLTYGGISSGIFKSTDGGEAWIKLVVGLPESSGRIGLDISRSNPAVLYAMHTDPVSGYLLGIYRSVNHGTNWTLLGTNEIDDYPYMWWFGKIFVDP